MLSAVVLVSASLAGALPGEAYFDDGRAAEHRARYADAIGHYQACAEIAGPLAPYATIRAAVCRSVAGDPPGATRELEGLLTSGDKGPWTALASHELALLYVKADKRQDAATLFARAHDSAVDIWWLDDVRWLAAENLLELPGEAETGRAFFRAMALHSPWTKKRYEAAKILAAAPTSSDRLIAALTLISAGASEDAVPIVAPLQPFVEGKPDLEPVWLRAQGRLDLVRGRMRSGREVLWDVSMRYPDTDAGRDALADLVSHYARRDEFVDAERALRRLVEIDPSAPQTFAARKTLAVTYTRERRVDAAADQYKAIAQLSASERDVRVALLDLAELYRDGQRPREALAYFDQVAAEYPKTSEGVEAAYWAGSLLQAAEIDESEVRNRLWAAVHNGLTEYYGYRALDALAELGDEEARHAKRLKITPREPLVRPIKQEFEKPQSAIAKLQDRDERVARLAYFASRGYPEAEWEALAIGRSLAGHPDPAELYEAMGEAGTTAYTAMQFANAYHFGDNDDGTQTIARLRIRYPRAYWDRVRQLGRELGIDPYLILSIARQESTYRPTLTSYAGAAGVMQLMPATAQWLTEKDPRLDSELADQLTNPANSLRLGAHYFRMMLDRYEGNVVYALAAYNAGPGNCDAWRRNFRGQSLEDFVESIPFTETRNYVKRILANYATYHSIYPPA